MEHAVPLAVEFARTQDRVPGLPHNVVAGTLLVSYDQPQHLKGASSAEQRKNQRLDHAERTANRTRVAPTLRPLNRQYAQIAADLHYTAPSFDAFDRLTDVDSALRSHQDMGGTAVNVDWKVGRGSITSTTAYRYWDWNPSNDRDFIGLPVTTISAAPSKQHQWTQEVRYAGDLTSNLNVVAGGFFFDQNLVSNPSFRQEQGAAAARFLLAPTAR